MTFKRRIRSPLALFTSVVFFLFFTDAIFAQEKTIRWESKEITQGVLWKHAHTFLFESPQNINILKVNLKKRDISLVLGAYKKYLTSEMAEEAGALAAVNAGFFNVKEGTSATYIKVDGELPYPDTTKWKQMETLNGALIIKRNGRIEVEPAGDNSRYTASKKYDDVLITGCLLLDEGKEMELPDKEFVNERHPRTCLGIVDKSTILLVTVDGRTTQAAGMSLFELTQLMKSLGCAETINLDGGGSTTMWLAAENGVVNNPSDNKKFDHEGEREVSNILVIR